MMRFKTIKSRTVYDIETEEGIFYQTNFAGSYWERLYGESWEPVYMDEEKQCKELWDKLRGVKQ